MKLTKEETRKVIKWLEEYDDVDYLRRNYESITICA